MSNLPDPPESNQQNPDLLDNPYEDDGLFLDDPDLDPDCWEPLVD